MKDKFPIYTKGSVRQKEYKNAEKISADSNTPTYNYNNVVYKNLKYVAPEVSAPKSQIVTTL